MHQVGHAALAEAARGDERQADALLAGEGAAGEPRPPPLRRLPDEEDDWGLNPADELELAQITEDAIRASPDESETSGCLRLYPLSGTPSRNSMAQLTLLLVSGSPAQSVSE